VYLADVKGLGYRQIADLTGVSDGTVKSSLHRGRGQLRARLGEFLAA
jgi:RNA polymerase sigma-70 factor, ECF subfamily